MDPVSLGVMSMGTSLLSSGIGAIGASQSASYQAAVARNNTIIAQRNHDYAIEAGEVQAENQNYKTRALLGDQKAKQGASGLDVNSGSPLDVRVSTAELGHLDALTILNNAQKQAAGYSAQAMQFESDAQMAEITGQYKVASSLLGGAASFSDKWLGYRERGTFS